MALAELLRRFFTLKLDQ